MKLRPLVLSLTGLFILLTCNSYAPVDTTNYMMKALWPQNPEAFVVFKNYPYTFSTGDGSYAAIRVYTVPGGFIDTAVATAAISGKSGSVYFVKTGSCNLYIEGTTKDGRKYADSLPGISAQNPFRISGSATIAIQHLTTLTLSPTPADMAPQAQVLWKVNGVVKATVDPAASYDFSSPSIGSFAVSASIADAGQKNVLQLDATTITVQLNPAPTYAVTVSATNGTVMKYPDKTAYDSGSIVGLKAHPAAGYHFVNWSGDASGNSDSVGVIVSGVKTITANFEVNAPGKFALSVTATNGSVTKTPDNTQYDSGSTVGLRAHPAAGYHFVNWSGDASGATDSMTVTMNGAKSVIANFAANPIPTYALTISATNGTVTKTPDKTAYDSGSAVGLKAHPAAGYHFVNWSGDASGAVDSVTVAMNGAKSVTAVFAANPPGTFGLTVTATNGTVTKTPDKTTYDSGSTVGLKAHPATGFHFVSWSGDATGTTDTTTVIVNSAKSVTAVFAANPIPTYALTVSATNGTVTKTPDKTAYDSGSTVGLKAHPATGYHFVSWSGDATGTSDSIAVIMTGAKAITATFEANVVGKFALSITSANGAVTKNPDKTQYDSASIVGLKAKPNTGYRFVNWSGDASGTSDSVTITMNGAKSVTANFAIVTYALAVTAANGTVTKTPDKAQYDSGSAVGLKAQPNSGYRFVNWSGGATGTADSATVVMNSAKSVTANFIKTCVLAVLTTDGGSVTKNPNQTAYDTGTVVTLTATATTGFHFTNWSGDLTGTTNPNAIIMTGAKIITANFVKDSFTVSFTAGTNGTISSGLTSQRIAYGENTAPVTALANAGYKFSNWSGGATGTTNPLTITNVTGNLAITANFVPLCQWTEVNTGIPQTTNIFALAALGNGIVASYNGGIYKSTNNGSSWTFQTGSSTYVGALVANQGNIIGGAPSRVIYSTDTGGTWNNSDLSEFAEDLAVNGNNVYAIDGSSGAVYKSNNGGVNWYLLTGVEHGGAYAITVNGNTIFTAGSGGGIYRATDNGNILTWTELTNGLPSGAGYSSKGLTSTSTTVFAAPQGGFGVYKSTTNGDSWVAANIGLPSGCTVNALFVDGGYIFAGTSQYGVYISSDNGASWAAVNTGLTNTDVKCFAMNGTNIFIGTGAGVFRSPLP